MTTSPKLIHYSHPLSNQKYYRFSFFKLQSFFNFFVKKDFIIKQSHKSKREGNKNKTIKIEIIVPRPKSVPIDEMATSDEINPTTKPATTNIVPEVKIVGRAL